jgi:hypothetical protein
MAFNCQGGKRSTAATDINPGQAGQWLQPVKKDLSGTPAPRSHHGVIAGAVPKVDGLTCHEPVLSRFRFSDEKTENSIEAGSPRRALPRLLPAETIGSDRVFRAAPGL